MENDIYEILNSYKDAIDVILQRLDGLVAENNDLKERLSKLEGILFDEILESETELLIAGCHGHTSLSGLSISLQPSISC